MITKALWESYIPGEPPEGCTFEMFSAALSYVWHKDDIKYGLKRLDVLRRLYAGTNNDEFKRLIKLEAQQIKEEIGEL